MKKIIFTLAITVGLALGASAQSDGFFSNWNDGGRDDNNDTPPGLPTTHGSNDNYNPAPLGGGLLILTALGAGYAVAKRKRD